MRTLRSLSFISVPDSGVRLPARMTSAVCRYLPDYSPLQSPGVVLSPSYSLRQTKDRSHMQVAALGDT